MSIVKKFCDKCGREIKADFNDPEEETPRVNVYSAMLFVGKKSWFKDDPPETVYNTRAELCALCKHKLDKLAQDFMASSENNES